MNYYRLLKSTPEFKKGAILEFRSGEYRAVYLKQVKKHSILSVGYQREVVENNPKWFEKVSRISDIYYFSDSELEILKDIIKLQYGLVARIKRRLGGRL